MYQKFFSHSFEVAVALVWTVVGLAYATNAHYTIVHSPINRELGIWEIVWIVLYLTGGPLTVFGVLWGHINFRIGGLMLLATGLGIQFVAAITAPFDIRSFTYLIYMLACALKVIMLHGIYFRGKQYQI